MFDFIAKQEETLERLVRRVVVSLFVIFLSSSSTSSLSSFTSIALSSSSSPYTKEQEILNIQVIR